MQSVNDLIPAKNPRLVYLLRCGGFVIKSSNKKNQGTTSSEQYVNLKLPRIIIRGYNPWIT